MKGLKFTWNPSLRAQERNADGEVTFIGERVLTISFENGLVLCNNNRDIYNYTYHMFNSFGCD